MNNCYVYCHTAPSGRKYVGISCDPTKRWNNGNGYKLNYLFYRAIKKYGWDNIEHEILYSGLSEEEAKSIEKELIDKLNLTDSRFGYNLREGGDGSLSASSKEKMSLARKGNNNCLGRQLSDQTKNKISESLKKYYESNNAQFQGRHHSPETIAKLKQRVFTEETRQKMRENHYNVHGSNNPSAKPVRMLSLDGVVLKEYEYAKAAAIEHGVDLSALIKCCRGNRRSCGGYKWEYIK